MMDYIMPCYTPVVISLLFLNVFGDIPMVELNSREK